MPVTIMQDGDLVEVADNDPRVPHPVPAVVQVPQSVDRRQGRLALFGAGLLNQVEALIAQAEVPVRIWYEDAATWDRQNPVFLAVSAMVQPPLSPEALDALFVQAAKL